MKEMKRPLAFVLSGGGARGAYQVGALRALYEAGYSPNIWVGTSVGSVNATYLALNGFTQQGLDSLVEAWHAAATADLLPSNYLYLTLRMLFNRAGIRPGHRFRDFFVAHGLTEDLKFKDVKDAKLYLVSADLNTAAPIIYGLNPEESILEGLLASTALPPWIHPIEKDGQFLMDGGVVSNLPIEPALMNGAKEIIALDLYDPRDIPVDTHGFGPFLYKLLSTVEKRQIELEIALAHSKGVIVHRIPLRGNKPVAIWEFERADELISIGYEITRQEIARWEEEKKPSRFSIFSFFKRR
jgi:NTE family protein